MIVVFLFSMMRKFRSGVQNAEQNLFGFGMSNCCTAPWLLRISRDTDNCVRSP
jgi:hypothetical protein